MKTSGPELWLRTGLLGIWSLMGCVPTPSTSPPPAASSSGGTASSAIGQSSAGTCSGCFSGSGGSPPTCNSGSGNALVVDAEKAVLVISPVGNTVEETVGDLVIPAGPYAALSGPDTLSAAPLASDTFAVASGGPLVSLQVWDLGGNPLATIQRNPDGTWPHSTFGQALRPVCLSGVDAEGNTTSRVNAPTYELVTTTGHGNWFAAYVGATDGVEQQDRLLRHVDGLDGRAATVRPTPVWRAWQPPSVATPTHPDAVAFDSARGVLVITDNTSVGGRPELWEYSSNTWTHRVDSGPGPGERSFVGLAYDATHQRTLLMGGYDRRVGGGPLNDLWSWDGTSWQELTPASGPQPPGGWERRIVAYDTGRDRLVVVAGNPPSTWEWNGLTWEDRTPALVPGGAQSGLCPNAMLPHPTGEGTAVYHPGLQRVVLVNPLFVQDCPNAGTWTWDGTTWTRIGTVGHSASQSALLLDSAQNRLLQVTNSGAVLALESGGWTVLELGTQSGIGVLAAYDSARQRVLRVDPSGAVTTWSGAGWSAQTTGGRPGVRTGLGLTGLPDATGLLTFGGQDASGFLDDAWTWDGNVWAPFVAVTPPPRADHAMVTDTAAQRVVLFGGEDALGVRGDTWELLGDVWQPVDSVPSPPARAGHAMAFDAAHGVTIVLGGHDGAGSALGDQWHLSGATWTMVTPTGDAPPARWGHAMAYDPGRQRVVLFGGVGQPTGDLLDDTWEWDGTSWTQLAPLDHPDARWNHALAYDPSRGRVVMTGGRVEYPTAETWEWDGQNWLDMSPNTTVSPLEHHAMALDPVNNRLVILRGFDTGLNKGQWHRDSTSLASPDPVPLATTRVGSPSVRVRAWCAGHAATPGARLMGAVFAEGPWEELAANNVDADPGSSAFPSGVAPLDSGTTSMNLGYVACAPRAGGLDSVVAVDFAEVRER